VVRSIQWEAYIALSTFSCMKSHLPASWTRRNYRIFAAILYMAFLANCPEEAKEMDDWENFP
jgi:hypothetical protein